MTRRILVPVDLKAPSAAALLRATELARSSGASLLLLHVIDVLGHGDAALAAGLESAGEHERRTLERLVPDDPRVPCEHRVLFGDPAARIVEVAALEHASMIVLGAPSRRFWPRLLRASVADAVLRAAPCAVLTVPSVTAAPPDVGPAAPPSVPTDRGGHRAEVLDRLRARLTAEVTTLSVWLQGQENAAEFIARVPLVRASMAGLRDLVRRADPEELLRSDALDRLRAYLVPVAHACGYVGFSVVDRHGVTLADSDDARVGLAVEPEAATFLARTLEGRAVVSRPYRAEGALAMFAGAPVSLDGTEPAATLCLRIHPELDYLRILAASRPGASSETYTFDAQGLLLSGSRFSDQLRRAGLLPNQARGDGLLDVRVCDPGGNVVTGHRPALPPEQRPLTRMASFATAGHDGVDLDGYRDYRGVEVVGAWMWLPEQGLGIATEIDVSEAY